MRDFTYHLVLAGFSEPSTGIEVRYPFCIGLAPSAPTQINSTLFNDLLMAIGSIAFVILYLRVTWHR